jgi:nucleoside-diphosphate-sugar epimerase
MKLLIGNTSQISHFYPKVVKISSRNINTKIFDSEWDEVHLPFGLNTKNHTQSDYDEVNYFYTLDLINQLKRKSQKIVVFSTCELWSDRCGKIDIDTDFKFHQHPYILSKWKLTEKLKSINDKKVIIVYPFNFNSTYRSKDFLFGKVFNSIINKQKIEIGDTHYFRDLMHTSFVANACQSLKEDTIIGSGRMFWVNDFIRDLYKHFNMNYDDYVTEIETINIAPKNEYYLKGNFYTYDRLLNDTLLDLNSCIDKSTIYGY